MFSSLIIRCIVIISWWYLSETIVDHQRHIMGILFKSIDTSKTSIAVIISAGNVMALPTSSFSAIPWYKKQIWLCTDRNKVLSSYKVCVIVPGRLCGLTFPLPQKVQTVAQCMSSKRNQHLDHFLRFLAFHLISGLSKMQPTLFHWHSQWQDIFQSWRICDRGCR